MPPKQCPGCGRFLPHAFVEGLARRPAPCPRCEDVLAAAMFEDEQAGSVRPPDLAPSAVRDAADDPLHGWDHGAHDAEIASWTGDRRPVPVDTLAVAGAGIAGTVVGLLLAPAHRLRGASVGALGGVTGAALGRRIWRLQV